MEEEEGSAGQRPHRAEVLSSGHALCRAGFPPASPGISKLRCTVLPTHSQRGDALPLGDVNSGEDSGSGMSPGAEAGQRVRVHERLCVRASQSLLPAGRASAPCAYAGLCPRRRGRRPGRVTSEAECSESRGQPRALPTAVDRVVQAEGFGPILRTRGG